MQRLTVVDDKVLQSTFCHIRGIGPRTERHLWRSGVGSWEAARGELPLPPRKAEPVRHGAEQSTARRPSVSECA